VYGGRLVLATTLGVDNGAASHRQLFATRVHLLRLFGEHEAAAATYREAAHRTAGAPRTATSASAPTTWRQGVGAYCFGTEARCSRRITQVGKAHRIRRSMPCGLVGSCEGRR
jgi:hypothetical protein